MATLQTIKNISVTTDNWTGKLFITSKIATVNLGCFTLDQPHTADYLRNQLDTVITDNVANIVKAVHDTFGKTHHLFCFAHTLHLVPTIAMENTVTFLKQSNNTADELCRLQFAKVKQKEPY